jgi:hypothetical protein
MILEAKVLLAELTTRNANVFYELGLAHAIGKPIVLISETMNDIPFDLQSLRVILYDKDDPQWGARLQVKITAALNETLSEPIKSVPSIFRKKTQSQAPEELKLSERVSELENKVSELENKFRIRQKARKRPISRTYERSPEIGGSGGFQDLYPLSHG